MGEQAVKKEEIFALPIAELGLSTIVRNHLVEHIKMYETPAFNFGYEEVRRRHCDTFAYQFTVKDLIAHVDAQIVQWGCDFYRSWYQVHWITKQLQDKLVELGLTQLDWIVLPSSTVTIDILQRLSREYLLQRSILVLGTLSSRAVDSLQELHQKVACKITLQNLLNTSLRAWKEIDHDGDYGKSIADTRQKLCQLSFSYRDGVFLQDGTRRQLAEDLRAKEKLSWKIAQKMADIAEKRGWVKQFVE